jgi:endonuclease YncB( thermonuclease family)
MSPPWPDRDRATRALRHTPPGGPLRLVLTGRRGAALSVGIAAGMMLAIASTLAGNAQLRGTPQVLDEVLDASRMVLAGQTIILADIVAPVLGEACRIGGNRLDCGRIARAGLLDLLAGATLECSAHGAGRHRCFADGYDVGFGLIHAGWAVPADDAPAHYKAKMHEAKARGRGLWSAIPEAGEAPSVAQRLQR